MRATLEWFGTATWRLTVGRTVVWLDAYITRAPTAAPPPEPVAGLQRADYILIGHSHFDHVADAGTLAARTGATVVGSALSCEIVRDEGVPANQTVVCQGGEVLELGPLTVRAYPSLHGFNGVREWPDGEGRTRADREAALRAEAPGLCEAALAHLRDIPVKQRQDGGPLAYLIEWDDFRLFWHDTPGMVTASWDAAAEEGPDLAILAAAAAFSTPNVDGEPFEAGPQAFVQQMATILQPGSVILNHHDDWCPPVTFHLDEETFRPGLELAGAALEIVRLGERYRLE